PAQVLRWVGGQLRNEALPIGEAMQRAANQLDVDAFNSLHPYVPPLLPLPMVPGGLSMVPPGQGTGCDHYTSPPQEPWWGGPAGWSAVWRPDGMGCPKGAMGCRTLGSGLH